LTLAGERDAVVLGPGLGQDPSTGTLVLEVVRRCETPLLVDADGLNALAAAPAEKRAEVLRPRVVPTVLTPHPGEMSRLTGEPVSKIQAHRLEVARDLARQTGTVVVLKGQRTVVAEPTGRAALNPTGNPGMGTGGTGDVLSGVVGALLARHGAWLAATAGVFVHGRAGDRAAESLGEEGLLAGDLAEAIPGVLRLLGRRRRT
jgi:NAD(P)H-hydrate epimerase